MQFKNTLNTYGSVEKTLHWLIAIAIIAMLIMGLLFGSMAPTTRSMLIPIHKSLGISILLLMAFRLYWRFANPVVQLPVTTPNWEKKLAHPSHWLLYILVFIMPISGWILSSAAGKQTVFWYWLNITLPITPNKDLATAALNVHTWTAWALIAVISLHILAALKHHYLDKDDVLKRMMPFVK